MKSDNMKSRLFNLFFALLFTVFYCLVDSGSLSVSAALISIILAYSATKHHYSFFIIESVLVFAAIAAFGSFSGGFEGFAAGFTDATIIIAFGVVLGLCTNLKASTSVTVLWCSGIYLASSLISLFVSGNSDMYSMLLGDMREIITQVIATQYGNSQEILDVVNETVNGLLSLTFTLMPATFICNAGLCAFVLVFAYKKVYKMLSKETEELFKLSTIRGNKTTAIAFLLSLMFFASVENLMISDALFNLLVVFLFIFFMCGICYINFSMKHKGANNTYRRLSVYVVLPLVTIMFAFPAFIIAGIGFIDCFADFRRRLKAKEGRNGAQ